MGFYPLSLNGLLQKSKKYWQVFLSIAGLGVISANSLFVLSVFIAMNSTTIIVINIWYMYSDLFMWLMIILNLYQFARFKFSIRNIGQLWDLLCFLDLELSAISFGISLLIAVGFLISSNLDYDSDLNYSSIVTVLKILTASQITLTLLIETDPRQEAFKKTTKKKPTALQKKLEKKVMDGRKRNQFSSSLEPEMSSKEEDDRRRSLVEAGKLPGRRNQTVLVRMSPRIVHEPLPSHPHTNETRLDFAHGTDAGTLLQPPLESLISRKRSSCEF
jgi:hypothetical protein